MDGRMDGWMGGCERGHTHPRTHPPPPLQVRERMEKFAIEEGMRGPMYGEAMTKMMEELSSNPSKLQEYVDNLPENLRDSLNDPSFKRSCQIWFMDLDQDGNGIFGWGH